MTLEAAVQDVVAKLTAKALTRGDGQPLVITDADPLPGKTDRPAAVCVTFAGIQPTDWRLSVRLYVDASSDVPAAEKLARSLTPSLDAALDAVPVPRSAWAKAFSPGFYAYVIETFLDYPRDDF